MSPGTGKTGNLFIGTSGWSYSWEGFYPKELPHGKYLEYYSRRFNTVEVNYSFYHLPRESTYEKWVRQTPADFTFALKLSRYITHIKRLSGVRGELKKFIDNAHVLKDRLGPILVQLPPNFKLDISRLEEFLEASSVLNMETPVPNSLRMAFEFRHKSWFDSTGIKEATKLLKHYKAAFIFAHSNRYPYPENEPVTADFVYLRYHGPEKMFASKYDKRGLRPWVPKIRNWLNSGKDVYAYFNNDVNGYAFMDAMTLIKFFQPTG